MTYIRIEVQFSDKLQKSLEKENVAEKKFIGNLVNAYRQKVDDLIKPLKSVDPKVKVKVYGSSV